jgi:hypothetical protein
MPSLQYSGPPHSNLVDSPSTTMSTNTGGSRGGCPVNHGGTQSGKTVATSCPGSCSFLDGIFGNAGSICGISCAHMGAAAGLACAGLVGYKYFGGGGQRKCPAMKKDGENTEKVDTAEIQKNESGEKTEHSGGFSLKYVKRLSDALLAKFSNAKKSMSPLNPMNRKHPVVLVEKGAKGQEQDQRLFMQMLWLKELIPGVSQGQVGAAAAATPGSSSKLQLTTRLLHQELAVAGIPHVMYDDVNDFSKVGVLTWSGNPSHFSGKVREIFQKVAGGGVFEVEEGLITMSDDEFRSKVREKAKEAQGENNSGEGFLLLLTMETLR